MENKMSEVAKIFGKNLYEKFHFEFKSETFVGYFTENGIVYGNDKNWMEDERMLIPFVFGECKIID